jgi:site-specific DNA recombinase
MAKQAIGYIRVSTSQQVRDGISLEAQKHKIRQWCEYKGYDLVGVFSDEGISGGSMKKRSELNHALTVIRKDMAFVIYSITRLSRRLRDLLYISDFLNDRGADLVSLSEEIDTTTPAGRAMFHVMGVFSELERESTSERTRVVKQLKKSKSEYNGGHVPYGFSLSSDRKILLPNEAEQKVVMMARELRTRAYTLAQICDILKDAYFKSRVEKPFMPTQIKRMLINYED